ncbi:hypothetical protein [Bradyrhizobium sp. USDA 3315]
MDGILSGVMPAHAGIQCAVTRGSSRTVLEYWSPACPLTTPNKLRGIAPRAALRRNNQNETAR